MAINTTILSGIGKITLGTAASVCGGVMIANGIGDIKEVADKRKLAAAASADATTEAAEDVDLGDLEDDLPDPDTAAGADEAAE